VPAVGRDADPRRAAVFEVCKADRYTYVIDTETAKGENYCILVVRRPDGAKLSLQELTEILRNGARAKGVWKNWRAGDSGYVIERIRHTSGISTDNRFGAVVAAKVRALEERSLGP
jgi:hypothetical protein